MFLLKEYIFKIEDFFKEIVLRKNDELVVDYLWKILLKLII